MFTYPYEILKKRLTDSVSELREIDWYLNQDSTSDNNASIKAAPALFIQFQPVNTQDLGTRIQHCIAEFDVIIITDCLYDTGTKRLKKDSASDHMSILDKVYNTLLGFSAKLSYLPEYASIQGTNSDQRVMNTITRISITPPHVPVKSLMKSVQRFRTTMYDHAGLIVYTNSNPELEINGEISS